MCATDEESVRVVSSTLHSPFIQPLSGRQDSPEARKEIKSLTVINNINNILIRLNRSSLY